MNNFLSKKLIPKIFTKEFLIILGIFLLSRIVLTIIGIIARNNFSMFESGLELPKSGISFLDMWGLWDGRWYLDIAQNGYPNSFSENIQSGYGFFPLFPICIKLLSFIIPNFFISALIVSNVSLFLALIIFYKLVRLDFDKKVSLFSCILILIFPITFFFSAIYSESLFLLLSVTCFYLARKNKFLFSSLIGLLATLARPTGFLLIIPILYEYLRLKQFKLKNIRADIFSLLLIPTGMIAFMTYLYFKTGDFFANFNIRKAWGHQFTDPISQLISMFDIVDYYSALNLTLVLIFIIGTIYMFFRKIFPISYPIYNSLILIMMLSSGGTLLQYCSGRLLLSGFSIYILLATIFKKPILSILLSLISIGFLLYTIFYWSLGYPPF